MSIESIILLGALSLSILMTLLVAATLYIGPDDCVLLCSLIPTYNDDCKETKKWKSTVIIPMITGSGNTIPIPTNVWHHDYECTRTYDNGTVFKWIETD